MSSTTSPTTEEKIIQLIGQVTSQTNDGNNGELLALLKPLVMAAQPHELLNVMDQIDLGPILKTLNQSASKLSVEEVTSVFGLVLEALPPRYIISRFINEIIGGLSSSNESLNLLWLKALNRCLSFDEICSELTDLIPQASIELIFSSVVALLGHETTSLGQHSHNILLKLAKNLNSQSVFFSDSLQSKLSSIKLKNDIVRMRVYELLVKIANLSPILLNRIDDSGHLNELINFFNRGAENDPLIALNCSQVISDLALTPRGVEYLETSGSVRLITEKIINSKEDPFGALTLPGYIKIITGIAFQRPHILRDEPRILTKIFELSTEKDQALLLSAIDSLNIISTTNEGKKMIDAHPDMKKCLASLGSLLVCSNGEVKVRVLSCLKNGFEMNESDPNGEATTIIEGWYKNLLETTHKTTCTLISLCRQPFMDIRLAALELVRVLVTHVWGQKELATFPGFLEYLLDRSSEFDPQGRDAKFQIVRELVNSPFTSLSFSREATMMLRKYFREGAHFVDVEVQVAVEGAS